MMNKYELIVSKLMRRISIDRTSAELMLRGVYDVTNLSVHQLQILRLLQLELAET